MGGEWGARGLFLKGRKDETGGLQKAVKCSRNVGKGGGYIKGQSQFETKDTVF